jgi:hypothetical protein
MKFFPESDVEDVDIKREEFRHVMREIFFIVGFIVHLLRIFLGIEFWLSSCYESLIEPVSDWQVLH